VRRDSLDGDERVVLLNAMEEGLLSELRYECEGDPRVAFERLWQAGLVSLYEVGTVGDDGAFEGPDVAAVIATPGLWDGTDPAAMSLALVATDEGASVFTGKC
jgi:hypothetical protein